MAHASDTAAPDAATPAVPAHVLPGARDLIALRALVPALRGMRPAARPLRAGLPAAPGAQVVAQRGRGLDFAELRAYQSGDDIRLIDWRRTARHGQPCTKVFHAERERVLRLLVDVSAGMRFGTRVAFKSVVAARCATLLAWAAERDGDRVAGLTGDGAGWTATAPRARRAGVLGLIRQLTRPGVAEADPSFAAGLGLLAAHLGTQDRVAIFSDFRELDAAGEACLLQIGRRAECLCVQVYDPFEADPPPGVYALTDGRRTLRVDFANAATRREHIAAFAAHRARIEALARRCGARHLLLSTATTPTAFAAAALT